MPVYDKRYEDPSIEYVNIVLRIVSPYANSNVSEGPPRFGKVELKHNQLGFLPIYSNYEDAMNDYPDVLIHQMRIFIEE